MLTVLFGEEAKLAPLDNQTEWQNLGAPSQAPRRRLNVSFTLF